MKIFKSHPLIGSRNIYVVSSTQHICNPLLGSRKRYVVSSTQHINITLGLLLISSCAFLQFPEESSPQHSNANDDSSSQSEDEYKGDYIETTAGEKVKD